MPTSVILSTKQSAMFDPIVTKLDVPKTTARHQEFNKEAGSQRLRRNIQRQQNPKELMTTYGLIDHSFDAAVPSPSHQSTLFRRDRLIKFI